MFPRVFQKRPVGEGEIDGGILVGRIVSGVSSSCLTRSVLRGRRDAVDDEDLHRSARWFEPQAQLLANRDSQRGQV